MSNTEPSSIIALPKGGGALHGLGEKFSPDLHTGTGNFTVPIALPAGRNNFQPQLNLVYSTGNGNALFGLGWSLGIPGITRKTFKGIPRYLDQTVDAMERDVFILSGAEDLVFMGRVTDEVGVETDKYRPRTEGLFAEIHRYLDSTAGKDFWRVRTKDGLVSYYGTNPLTSEHPRYPGGSTGPEDCAIVSKPNHSTDIFSWRLTLTKDPFGNRIEYLYDSDEGDKDGHAWRQPLLKQIRYADYGDPENPAFLITATFEYEDRPDPFSDYRAAFEIRTSVRCRSILIETHADRTRQARRYEFTYQQDTHTQLSLLRTIEVVGFDDAGAEARELPPLEFSYANFDPQDRKRRDFYPLQGFNLPASSLSNPSLELVDLFGTGLPDILEMNGTVRYWRNRGGGCFAVPDDMDDSPAEMLADVGVQLIDANGNGRTDLLVTRSSISGYYPLQFGGLWDRRSFQKYVYAPSFNFEDPEVHLVDLTGDGITDVIRSGTRLECFFNDARDGWRRDNVHWEQRAPLESFPNVNFSDPRVKWGDFSGDNMQDIALIYDGNVEYWPNLGYGKWGMRLHMHNSPRFPLHYDPRRILVGDVNGDGLADIVYVDDRRISLWINQSGNAWSDEIQIEGTPPVSDMDSVRLTDLLGSGISGVLWTKNARSASEDHYFFLDLTGGTKPYLLNEMKNNMGAVTKVAYAPSTKYYLEDENKSKTRWMTTLPFPVQVVSRVEAIDEISGGKLTTEYRYHHGYWDGVEREFRGFARVEQLSTEAFERYHEPGLHGADRFFEQIDLQHFSSPTLTKTWFHEGPIGDDETNWQEMDWSDEFWQGDSQQLDHVENTNRILSQLGQQYAGLTSREQRQIKRDALRSLRGNVIRTELFAMDGTAREGRPYTVTEHSYGVREESAPMGPSNRPRIFFPHPLTQRTTQWERGDDPMTSLIYTQDYDAFGNALTSIHVACPRGWRHLDDALRASYLATVGKTEIAVPATGDVYIHDRVARAVTYEILNPQIPDPADPGVDPKLGRTVADVLGLALDPQNRRIISESINFYDAESALPEMGEFVGMPFRMLGQYGAVTRSESLVLTDDMMTAIYGTQVPPYLRPGQPFSASAAYPAGFAQQLAPLAGYFYRAAGSGYSGGYYVATERKRFDFHGNGVVHGLVLASLDPLGVQTIREYDQPYAILPILVTNAVNLSVRASYNYRVLQAESITDPNGNRSNVSFSPAGLVTSTWVRGKTAEDVGDLLRPSAVIEYNFLDFIHSKEQDPNRPRPIFVRTLRFLCHDSDINDKGDAIETREYSDGFGRLIQTRIQGERVRFGDAIFGGGNSVLPAQQSDGRGSAVQGVDNDDLESPNVIVSGWQRYDNKSRVVQKYEPFFALGWAFTPTPTDQSPLQINLGAKVTMFYDPRGQLTRTVNPDGSEQRVIYGVPQSLDEPTEPDRIDPTPWEAYTYDTNDNAGRTHVGTSGNYRHHWNTPTSVAVDALGRTIVATARNRAKPASRTGAALPAIEEHRTRSIYDIQGNLLQLIDPLNRSAFAHAYDLANHALRIDSIDAGWRLVVFNPRGQEIERSDTKGARVLRSYDLLGRPDRMWARNAGNQTVTLREQSFYGDGSNPNQATNARALARVSNLLGNIARQLDGAGELIFGSYDFKGNLLSKIRRVIADGPLIAALNAPGSPARGFVVNWNNPPPLAGSYETTLTYDALNRITTMRYPRDVNGARKMLVPRYNNAGVLESITLEGNVFVERIAYNAKGQRVLIAYGNGLMTRYAYDPAMFRLVRMRTEQFVARPALAYQPQGIPLQDFEYTYDLTGNILRIAEQVPGCGVRNNARSYEYPQLQTLLGAGDALVRTFEYDPLYRLTYATGREANSIPTGERSWDDLARPGFGGFNWGSPGTPRPETARDQTRIYEETYSYDAADNMLTMGHGTWTRRFGMSGFTPESWSQEWRTHLDPTIEWGMTTNNRLTHVGDNQPRALQTHFFDGNGNLIRQNTERHFAWDAADRMIAFANRVGDRNATIEACYLYDAAGQRVKKLVRIGASVETTLYIDGTFERVTMGANQHDTLHLMDANRRIARIRIGRSALQDDLGPTVQFDLRDSTGGVSVIVGGTDASAREFINREEFFPYGETSFGSFARKRYRYVASERDESGFCCHSLRYYVPWIGRWASTDPVGPVEGANIYVYSLNSPVTRSDANGLQSGGVVDSDAGHTNVPNTTGTSDAGTDYSYGEVAGASPAQIVGGEGGEARQSQDKYSSTLSKGKVKVDSDLSTSVNFGSKSRDDVLTGKKDEKKVTTKGSSNLGVTFTGLSGESGNKLNWESYDISAEQGSWIRSSKEVSKYSAFSFGISTSGDFKVIVGQASFTTSSTEVGGSYGSWISALTWDLTETGPSFKATAGIENGEAQLVLGATLANYQGSVGVDWLGLNISIVGEINVGGKVGFEIGSTTMAHAAVVGLGIQVGSYKTPDPPSEKEVGLLQRFVNLMYVPGPVLPPFF
jgi:RHS repeat-associated protein